MKHLKPALFASLVLSLAGARAVHAQTNPDGSTTAPQAPAAAPGPSDEASTEAPAEAAPTTPPAEETAEQPPSDAPAEAVPAEGTAEQAPPVAEEAAPPPPEPLAWRNSFLFWTIGATFNTFLRDSQLSYNPNVYQYWFLQPRWYIDNSTFFALGLGGSIEHTADDGSAVRNNEFQLFDMSIEVRRMVPFEGFIFIPAVRLALPTSKLSQAAQRYVNTGVGLTVVRPIPEAAGMTLAANFAYRHWFAGSNVSLAQGQCLPLAPGGDGSFATAANAGAASACNGAGTTEADRIIAGLTVNITPVEHLTVSLSGQFFWINAHSLSDALIDTASGQVRIPDGSPNHWRNFTSYSLTVAYDIVEWFNLSLAVQNSTFLAPLFNDDGSVRSPFNPDTQITLNAQFTLDGFYSQYFMPHAEEEDGLTPEERQRRRQGLGFREQSDDESDPAARGARL